MWKLRNAFSLMELLITVSIVGVIAAFGIPAYNGAMDKADEAEIVGNMRIISAAMEQYFTQNGEYPDTVAFPLGVIRDEELNQVLFINIRPRDWITYACVTFAGPDGYECYGGESTVAGPMYILDITHGSSGRPRCVGIIPCPSRNIGQFY